MNNTEEKKEAVLTPEAEEKIETEATEAVSKEEEYLSGWKRCQADFENYKRRQIEERKDWNRHALENLISEIIPVLDNFEASLGHIPEGAKNSPWVIGILHIQKQLEKVLVDHGCQVIPSKIGEVFNPSMEEAVQMETHEAEEEKSETPIIKKIVLKGYQMNGKVIRATRVIVG